MTHRPGCGRAWTNTRDAPPRTLAASRSPNEQATWESETEAAPGSKGVIHVLPQPGDAKKGPISFAHAMQGHLDQYVPRR